MTLFQKLRLGFAFLMDAAGLVYVGFAAYYSIMLAVDANNPLHYEYNLGIWGGILYGFACMLAATFLAIS